SERVRAGDADAIVAAIICPWLSWLGHVPESCACNSGRPVPLASHDSDAHVRLPFLRAVSLKRMYHLRRLILGSARISRVWFRRRAETEFHSSANQVVEANPQKKLAIGKRARQTRETRALLRILRSRYVIACALVLSLIAIALVWWLPSASELQTSAAGTLTLPDCRA